MSNQTRGSDATEPHNHHNKKWIQGVLFLAIVLEVLLTSEIIPSAVDMEKPLFGALDKSNDSLQGKSGKLSKIYERSKEGEKQHLLMKGPETVVFDANGTMYVLTEEAKLVSLTDIRPDKTRSDTSVHMLSATTTEVAHLGVGRPLGGAFASDGCLYVADAILGLIKVTFFTDDDKKRPRVEIVANRVMVNGTWSPIVFADDVVVGPKSGHVYFTDASDIPPPRVGTRTWDAMQAAKQDGLRGKRTGRLLRYDPFKDTVQVLASNMSFANGVAVDPVDEQYVVVSETFAVRQRIFHIAGPKAGTLDIMVHSLPGMPDGADCSANTGKCYAALVSKEPLSLKLLFLLPKYVHRRLRTVLLLLPGWMQPKSVPYGGFAEIKPGRGGDPSVVTRILQDPNGQDIGMITGVTERDGKLFLGSLENDFVGVYDLR